MPAGANRFALRPHGATALLVFDPADARLADPKAPASPAPRETVEIYRVGDLPAVLATLLPAALHTLAAAELAGKQYDKTQTHKTEKYVDLPDPRLTDLKHKKRHKVISVTEEDHVQAQLDGPADIHIPALPYLAGYAKDGPGVILLGVDARLPVRGHVQCKLPDLASASTGFRAAVELSAVAEVGVQRAGGDVKLGPPAVLDLRVLGPAAGPFQRRVGDRPPPDPRRDQPRVAAQRGADSPAGQPRPGQGDVLARGPHPARRLPDAVSIHHKIHHGERTSPVLGLGV